MNENIIIKPMDDSYLHLLCLHKGPIDTSKIEEVDEQSPIDCPPRPWRDDTICKLIANNQLNCHGGTDTPILREFFREMIQRYGTCAMLAQQGKKIVGHLRFYPMRVARWFVPVQTDPSPVLDCTAACQPEDDEGTLWVQCVMTSKPYENTEQARQHGAGKGIGQKLVESLIAWAREHCWKQIVKVAHCDLDWFYGIQGGGGKSFWIKAGFKVAGSFYKHAWNFDKEAKAIVQAQMAEKGMTEGDIWTWYRMVYEL